MAGRAARFDKVLARPARQRRLDGSYVAIPGSAQVLLGSVSGAGCPAGPVDCIPGDDISHQGGSLRFASDGTLYFGFDGSDGHAYVAVSHDEGQTWTNLQDVGASLGRNVL